MRIGLSKAQRRVLSEIAANPEVHARGHSRRIIYELVSLGFVVALVLVGAGFFECFTAFQVKLGDHGPASFLQRR